MLTRRTPRPDRARALSRAEVDEDRVPPLDDLRISRDT
jgi:hypothetical protein